jgi:hypothetical protein
MKKNLAKINVLNLVLVLVLLGFTLFKINLLVKEALSIESMKREITELSKGNQKLEDEALSINSISHLDQFLENSNFVKAEKIKFIQVFEGRVVAK